MHDIDTIIKDLTRLRDAHHGDSAQSEKQKYDNACLALIGIGRLQKILAHWAIPHIFTWRLSGATGQEQQRAARRQAFAEIADLLMIDPTRELREALEYINNGEIHPLFQPTKRKRKLLPIIRGKEDAIRAAHWVTWTAFKGGNQRKAAQDLGLLPTYTTTDRANTLKTWKAKHFPAGAAADFLDDLKHSAGACRGVFPEAVHPDWFLSRPQHELYEDLRSAGKYTEGAPYIHFVLTNPLPPASKPPFA